MQLKQTAEQLKYSEKLHGLIEYYNSLKQCRDGTSNSNNCPLERKIKRVENRIKKLWNNSPYQFS